MELLEFIWLLVQGCGCFLDVLALLGWLSAGGAGLQARKKFNEHRAAATERATQDQEGVTVAEQERPAPVDYERSVWIFLALLVLAMILTVLAIWRWVR
jgi:hypothetical protein